MEVVNLFPSQLDLHLILSTVQGNVDYHDFRLQLTRIDKMVRSSRLEEGYISQAVKIWLADKPVCSKTKAKQQIKIQELTRRALRSNIARALLGEDYRGFSMRLADSQLL